MYLFDVGVIRYVDLGLRSDTECCVCDVTIKDTLDFLAHRLLRKRKHWRDFVMFSFCKEKTCTAVLVN